MRRVISFGSYTFPDTIPARGEIVRTNFGNTVTRAVRLPGMDGTFDEMGGDRNPSEAGDVRCRFALVAGTPDDMADQIDAVMAMAQSGRAALTIETQSGDQRWTWAKVNNISLPIEPDVYSARLVEVTVDFQVTLPVWFSTSADSPQTEACSGVATTFQVVNAGNAAAIPVITITAGAGGLADGVTLQQLAGSSPDVIHDGEALAAGDVLVIDCRALTVTKNGADAYGVEFAAGHPAWLRLIPGSSQIKVALGASETASVKFEWDDTWR